MEITMKLVDGVKTIFMGTTNDATVYATKEFTPLNKKDLEFQMPEYEIKCDSGVHFVQDYDQYICNEASKWLTED